MCWCPTMYAFISYGNTATQVRTYTLHVEIKPRSHSSDCIYYTTYVHTDRCMSCNVWWKSSHTLPRRTVYVIPSMYILCMHTACVHVLSDTRSSSTYLERGRGKISDWSKWFEGQDTSHSMCASYNECKQCVCECTRASSHELNLRIPRERMRQTIWRRKLFTSACSTCPCTPVRMVRLQSTISAQEFCSFWFSCSWVSFSFYRVSCCVLHWCVCPGVCVCVCVWKRRRKRPEGELQRHSRCINIFTIAFS